MSSSSAPELIRNPAEWLRVGRGHERQFYATDAEVAAFLQEGLPIDCGPYRLVGTDIIEVARRQFERRPFDIGLSELGVALARGRWDFWILPTKLVPRLWLNNVPPKDRDSLCSLNGLVMLQHGTTIRGKRDASRIAVVSRVQNVRTQAIVAHDRHKEIFKALKKRIDKSLCYATINVFRDGHEEEDDRLQLMTEGAAEEARKAWVFVDKVGRRLS